MSQDQKPFLLLVSKGFPHSIETVVSLRKKLKPQKHINIIKGSHRLPFSLTVLPKAAMRTISEYV